MKIIFVGIHNKPHTAPLCSSTKSGKVIDRIIKQLPGREVIKTNLYGIDYMPTTKKMKWALVLNWNSRIQPDQHDMVILLGKEVQRNFPMDLLFIIKLAHPSSIWSGIALDKYITDAVMQIKGENT